ncbi:ATP-NAD kinase family protein [Massilia sp. CFBP9026]|uniref:ATP-NAD kinase family protein n=1 Tax=Massilia sp. CFBP9026 TaxID=3096536 RepID=UPI002A6A7562|nr:ATP-NAD kinase family protein [Massilia sp. CFBP9026]MDY0960682.1 ATP-NAD kinase family protein [Massilia sp. CFBP9026]
MSATPLSRTIGLIVNPIAGMGGRVGLKGTDGAAALEEARRRGALPASQERVMKALLRLAASCPGLAVLTAAGALGEDAARRAGLAPTLVHTPASVASSSAADTRAAARAMLDAKVDLLLFAGGDGTARDILDVVGNRIPLLGIPAGVKMVSAVFGTTPGNVGTLAARFLAGDRAVRLREAEVMDIDEDAMRGDRVSTRLYGYASNPYAPALSQNAKAGSSLREDVALEAVCRQVAREMEPGRLYILGPGTTTRRVMSALSLPATLLGVDVVADRKLLGSDLAEADLLRLMEGRETALVVGVLGGHGSLFGRGNQQISSEVIRRVGRANIIVVASMDKLLQLSPRSLHVDTGDEALDAMLAGHLPVRTAPDRSIFFQVQS